MGRADGTLPSPVASMQQNVVLWRASGQRKSRSREKVAQRPMVAARTTVGPNVRRYAQSAVPKSPKGLANGRFQKELPERLPGVVPQRKGDASNGDVAGQH